MSGKHTRATDTVLNMTGSGESVDRITAQRSSEIKPAKISKPPNTKLKSITRSRHRKLGKPSPWSSDGTLSIL
jgi:hypothetical protein